MPSDEEKNEEGFSICNEEITSDEEEGVVLDEENYDEEELGNDD